MKDRIRQIMESQHMTQQTFAQFIGMSPASLSSIFNGRTRPTINIVEAIKNKIPKISTDWLLFGTGPMYEDNASNVEPNSGVNSSADSSQMFVFEDETPAPPASLFDAENGRKDNRLLQNSERVTMKYIDKPQRKITEIRVFYDDQTWETFSPNK